MEFQNISFKIIIILFIQAFWIISAFLVIQHIVIRMIKNERLHDWLAFYIPLIRNIVWTLFVLRMVSILGKYQPIFTLFIVGVMVALTWSVLRDFIQGTIFRLQKGDIVGQQIQLENYKGTVLKTGETKMSIELKNGEIVQLPYNKLFTDVIIKPISNRQIKTQTLILPISRNKAIDAVKTELIKKIVAYPWVVIKNGIVVDFFNDDQQERKVKLSYAISSSSKGLAIEEDLRKFVATI